MATAPRIGQKAPDFTLTDTELKPRTLKEFEGSKVVLAFFVNAFTRVCTKEMCEFRDSTANLIKLKAQVLGISVNDPFSNSVFAEKNKLPFPILSDYNREVIRAYDLETADYEGLKGYTVARRSIFLLDSQGIIRYIWTAKDSNDEPNYNEIKEALEKIS